MDQSSTAAFVKPAIFPHLVHFMLGPLKMNFWKLLKQNFSQVRYPPWHPTNDIKAHSAIVLRRCIGSYWCCD